MTQVVSTSLPLKNFDEVEMYHVFSQNPPNHLIQADLQSYVPPVVVMPGDKEPEPTPEVFHKQTIFNCQYLFNNFL